jgi:hypothetical protein
MADVTEVIHKISYEVNAEGLQQVTRIIQLQITELNNLAKTLQGYQRQLSATKASEIQKFNELSRKIDETNRKIEASGSRLRGTFEQIGNGMLKGLGFDGKLNTAVEDFTGKLVGGFKNLEHLRLLQEQALK